VITDYFFFLPAAFFFFAATLLTPDQFMCFYFLFSGKTILPSTLGQPGCSDSACDWQSFFSTFSQRFFYFDTDKSHHS
jgi:hypothetical protein